MTRSLRLQNGIQVLLEPSDELPLVNLGLSLRVGSLLDPQGKEGLTRLTARMVRMGTRALQGEQVEQRLDMLGAHLSTAVAPSYVHYSGAVLTESLRPFLELLSGLFLRPALRTGDLDQLVRETSGQLVSLCDDDRALVSRHFRAHALSGHPLSRSAVGSLASLSTIKRRDVVEQHGRLFVGGNAIMTVSGDFEPDRLQALLERTLGKLPVGKADVPSVSHPRMARGRRLLLVDKPERTQTQVLIGTLGSHPRDPEHVPLVVSNTAFGGLFTARLTHEVRSKRGWSYGAGSSLSQERKRDMWSMWTFPAATDAVACIELQLKLYEDWIDKGLSSEELATAKNYLERSYAFDVDTAAKRVDQRLDSLLFNLPRDFYDGFTKNVAAVSKRAANQAAQRRLSKRDMALVVVATADELEPALSRLPGITSVERVPFDQV